MATSEKIGRYEVLEELGQGAMGTVYRAKDPAMDRIVAVKTINLVVLVSEHGTQFRERFYREARAAGALAHPGIVPIFDVGEHEGSPFLVMEFVNGRTLADAIKKGERVTIDRACEMGQKIAEALGYAHQHGVVHRDIKPANILLTSKETYGIERPKIADFGVAKLAEGRTTLTGQLVGTPAFMPPEQFLGGPIDGRADLFSLGVVLYWMVTGEQPFPGESITAVSYKVVHTDPVSPRKLNPWVSVPLDLVIMKCLAKSPDERYQTGEELARELSRVREESKAQAERRTAASQPVQAAGWSGAAAAAAPAMQKQAGALDLDATIDGSIVTNRPATSAQAATAQPAMPPISPTAKTAGKGTINGKFVIAAVAAVLLAGGGWYGMQVKQRAEAHQKSEAAPPSSPATPASAVAAGTNDKPAAGDPNSATDSHTAATAASGQKDSSTPAAPDAPAVPAVKEAPPKSAQTNSPATKKAAVKTVAKLNSSPVMKVAPAPTPVPPPVAVAFDPKTLDPKQNARLKLDTSRLPAGLDIAVEMNGQLYLRKTSNLNASEEDLFVPPGIWEFRVTAKSGEMQKASNTVSAEFKAKKKLTLRVELRDKAATQTNAVPQGIYPDTQVLLSLK
jgi:serine/threonine-protein kinase